MEKETCPICERETSREELDNFGNCIHCEHIKFDAMQAEEEA